MAVAQRLELALAWDYRKATLLKEIQEAHHSSALVGASSSCGLSLNGILVHRGAINCSLTWCLRQPLFSCANVAAFVIETILLG